ncbi:hypothetical protein [Dryocola sp. BD613]|uniref:hypothetical protein n=1 Tax=Dryocola sp. BD613 TaxID=3133272 RepID=UPI003F503FFF
MRAVISLSNFLSFGLSHTQTVCVEVIRLMNRCNSQNLAHSPCVRLPLANCLSLLHPSRCYTWPGASHDARAGRARL